MAIVNIMGAIFLITVDIIIILIGSIQQTSNENSYNTLLEAGCQNNKKKKKRLSLS